MLATFAVETHADDSEAAHRLEQGLAALASIKADFAQEILPHDGGTPEHASGTLWLKKPGRFRWDYRAPAQVIVCDGEHLWLYDADLAQVTVRRVKETLSDTPAMLLSGDLKIREGFEIHEGGTLDGLVWSVLVPKGRDTDFREIRVGLLGATVRRLEFTDKLNQHTRIELSHLERNVAIPDSVFHFVVPAGVDVIGNGR